jgi:hypothetical protein
MTYQTDIISKGEHMRDLILIRLTCVHNTGMTIVMGIGLIFKIDDQGFNTER